MANMSYGGAATSSYLDLARRGQIFVAQATLTAPVGYTTTVGIGGPLLWNGSGGAVNGVNQQAVDAVLIGYGWGLTTPSSVATGMGIIGNGGQPTAPSATTPIDGIARTRIGLGNIGPNGAGNLCSAYRVGTVLLQSNFFAPQSGLGAAPNAVLPNIVKFVALEGLYVVPPGSWASVGFANSPTAWVANVSLFWAEIPRL